MPSMPTARRSLAAAAVAGKVYAIGGACEEGGPFAIVEAYDPLPGEWTQVASLSVARSGHTATVVEGKIYVLGGEILEPGRDEYASDECCTIVTDRVDVYDPATDSWQQLASMPSARRGHAAALL